MNRIIILSFLILLLTGCYVSREHRLWDKRYEKGVPDNYFFQVLKDSAKDTDVRIKLRHPYVSFTNTGVFHAYSFDQNQKVYSNAWRSDSPNLAEIVSSQFEIGYYKTYHDTLIIEQIASWRLFHMPWKFIHTKKVGVISGDTITLSKAAMSIKRRTRVQLPFNIYTPFNPKS